MSLYNQQELDAQIQAAASPIEQVDIINEWAYSLRLSNPTLTGELAQRAREMATRQHYTAGVARAWRNIGISNATLGNLEQSLSDFQNAWALYNELEDKEGLAMVTGNIGSIYQQLGQPDKALEWQFRSLELAEDLGLKQWVSNTLGNIGNIYTSLHQYEIATKFYEDAIKLKQELNDLSGLAIVYGAYGTIHEYQSSHQTALEYQQKSLEYARQTGDKMLIGYPLLYIGSIQKNLGQYGTALRSLFEALAIFEEIGNRRALASTFVHLALLYLEMGQLEDAEEHVNRAIDIARDISSRNLECDGLRCLAQVAEKKGDFRKAFEQHKLYTQLHLEILDLSNKQILENLRIRYNFENAEKEKEIHRLKNIELVQANLAIQTQKEILESMVKELQANTQLLNQQTKDLLISLQYARKIQESIFPDESQIRTVFPNSFIWEKPKQIVFGDFCWIAEKNGLLLAAAADCTGHGVPAAILSIIGYFLLNEIVLSKGITEPAKILNQLHSGMRQILRQSNPTNNSEQSRDGMDIALCCIDTQMKEIQFAGAYNSLFISKRGQVEEIKADKLSVGGDQKEVFRIFTNHRLPYFGGETLYLCTDGFMNQFGGNEQKRFQSKRMKELFTKYRAYDMTEQAALFEKEFNEWKGTNEQTDDVLILGIRLN
ncbi:MAG: tetratricopeptide repeat protein [Bacteroidia bacterium]|nr:tetratricopeptide repeat protein [Bacteroidia bacterium]